MGRVRPRGVARRWPTGGDGRQDALCPQQEVGKGSQCPRGLSWERRVGSDCGQPAVQGSRSSSFCGGQESGQVTLFPKFLLHHALVE